MYSRYTSVLYYLNQLNVSKRFAKIILITVKIYQCVMTWSSCSCWQNGYWLRLKLKLIFFVGLPWIFLKRRVANHSIYPTTITWKINVFDDYIIILYDNMYTYTILLLYHMHIILYLPTQLPYAVDLIQNVFF